MWRMKEQPVFHWKKQITLAEYQILLFQDAHNNA